MHYNDSTMFSRGLLLCVLAHIDERSIWVPLSRFEFDRIDLAITSLWANQPVASESERARDQCQRAAVTPAGQSQFFVPVSCLQTYLLFCEIQLTVSIVVSVIAVFRLVDNFMHSRRQIIH